MRWANEPISWTAELRDAVLAVFSPHAGSRGSPLQVGETPTFIG
jgi:hypothetical protein